MPMVSTVLDLDAYLYVCLFRIVPFRGSKRALATTKFALCGCLARFALQIFLRASPALLTEEPPGAFSIRVSQGGSSSVS